MSDNFDVKECLFSDTCSHNSEPGTPTTNPTVSNSKLTSGTTFGLELGIIDELMKQQTEPINVFAAPEIYQRYNPEQTFSHDPDNCFDKGARIEVIYQTLSNQANEYKFNIIDKVTNSNIGQEVSNFMINYYVYLMATHHPHYIDFLRKACEYNKSFRASTFALPELRDEYTHTLARRSDPEKYYGYFCFDTDTPITPFTFQMALISCHLACEAATDLVHRVVTQQKNQFAQRCINYALCRTPGHHACYSTCGGYCYFNNACVSALVARDLFSMFRYNMGAGAKVMILDLDYHQGNGCMQIVRQWESTKHNKDKSIRYVSFQHDTQVEPYFLNYPDTGKQRSRLSLDVDLSDSGPVALNVLVPASAPELMPVDSVTKEPVTIAEAYFTLLTELCRKMVFDFCPDCLIISLGTDSCCFDPLNEVHQKGINQTGLSPSDFYSMGTVIGDCVPYLPVLVLQEGGYNTDVNGQCVSEFLRGLRCDTR